MLYLVLPTTTWACFPSIIFSVGERKTENLKAHPSLENLGFNGSLQNNHNITTTIIVACVSLEKRVSPLSQACHGSIASSHLANSIQFLRTIEGCKRFEKLKYIREYYAEDAAISSSPELRKPEDHAIRHALK
jgi:hypothetical protein